MADPFVAEIRIVGFDYAPRGWALCNGQILPIAQNTPLFSLLGTTYGGDGQFTFGLPSLQGRTPMHPGQGPGLSPRILGQTGGQATVALSLGAMPAHAHGLQAAPSNPPTATSTPGPAAALTTASAPIYGPPSDPVAMASEAIEPVGDGQPHQNRQPFLTLNFVIALQGVFPPRP